MKTELPYYKLTQRVPLLLAIILFPILTVAQSDDEEIKIANEYYAQSNYEKARTLYDDLVKDMRNIPLIHNNYLYILIESADYKTAEKYLTKVIKRFPDNLYYELDMGLVYWSQDQRELADIWFSEIINRNSLDSYKTRITAQYFVSKQLTDYAIKTFVTARLAIGNPYVYSLELANIYRITSDKDLMVEEYLNYIVNNPANLTYVKNTLQSLLTEPEELESLEYLLYNKVQSEPDNTIYGELLIWVNLQQKNFYAAFIQARALDKRLKTEGSRSNRIGLIALDNNDFDTSIKIFTYVIKTYPTSVNYVMAKMYLIKTYEERVRRTYPVDEREIRNLIYDYNIFINEMGINRNTLEALRNKALLHAFYLDEKDSAIQILERIGETTRVNDDIRAASKLDLGDIYLLVDQPWESTLYYSQVEKTHKESKIGYDAKLRNAKLSYYRGDFNLALEHLNILKQATTREIANDAMELSLLIKDNTVFDTTGYALKQYAKIELLLFQHKKEEALRAVQTMKQEYQDHSIIDDVLWLESKINLELGHFETAIELLDEIVENHGSDIWGDDAYYQIAYIYDFHLVMKDRAMDIYRNFLTKYPGSVFVAMARKRFRELRGDYNTQDEPAIHPVEELN